LQAAQKHIDVNGTISSMAVSVKPDHTT